MDVAKIIHQVESDFGDVNQFGYMEIDGEPHYFEKVNGKIEVLIKIDKYDNFNLHS